jgi:hypothetical protein
MVFVWIIVQQQSSVRLLFEIVYFVHKIKAILLNKPVNGLFVVLLRLANHRHNAGGKAVCCKRFAVVFLGVGAVLRLC